MRLHEYLCSAKGYAEVGKLTPDISECIDETWASAVGSAAVRTLQLSLKMTATVSHSSIDAP